MKAKTAEEIQGELDTRYARFGLHPMTDEDVWNLSMATMVMPDGNPGAEGYLAQVSGTPLFDARLQVWGLVVAIGIAGAGYKAPGGVRRRSYVEGYDESWGRYAVADGLSVALHGKCPGLCERADQLKVGKQGYQRIRDFVGGAMVNAIAEFRVALEWASGYRRDRVLSGRWEGVTGVSWDDARRDANISGDGSTRGPLFAPGCARIDTRSDADDTQQSDPENVYHSLRPSDWWDAAYARQMRDAPVVKLYAPPRN